MSTTASVETAISVDSLRKSFANEEVLRGIDLDIDDGEFCVVVGPSGSGKSTLLKCIAGLLDYDGGTVSLQGEDVSDVPTRDRGLGFVFQDFEERLFPHMTVRDNVAFGLEQSDEDISAAEIDERIEETLDLLAIPETADDVPGSLSGGQQQRVELARQLVRRCDVMLLDDPLADLDYKLQKRMELEMRSIHSDLGSTFVYVTHNQDQALKLADKLVVMNQGMLEQVGTPEEVYSNPATAFVGRFVGDTNPVLGNVVDHEGDAAVVDAKIGQVRAEPRYDLPAEGTEVIVLVRPEDMRLGDEAADCDNVVPARLEGRTYTGEYTEFTVSVEGSTENFEVLKRGNVPRESVEEETRVGWNTEDGIAHETLSVSDTVTVDDLLEV